MKSKIISILFLLVGISGIHAQSLTVTGKVVDNEGSDWGKCNCERQTKRRYYHRHQR